jgi:hypothetical protein
MLGSQSCKVIHQVDKKDQYLFPCWNNGRVLVGPPGRDRQKGMALRNLLNFPQEYEQRLADTKGMSAETISTDLVAARDALISAADRARKLKLMLSPLLS